MLRRAPTLDFKCRRPRLLPRKALVLITPFSSLCRIVASLDRKRLGQDRWQGRKTGSEAFSIRRLGGRRWRGGRGPMGFECAPGVRLRDGRAGWKCESSLVIMGRAANGWNGRLEKGQSRQGG